MADMIHEISFSQIHSDLCKIEGNIINSAQGAVNKGGWDWRPNI